MSSYSRSGGRAAAVPGASYRSNSEQAFFDKPPQYTKSAARSTLVYDDDETRGSRRNPKNWSRRCWIILAAIVVVVLAIVIPVAVVVSRANRYPDYSTLNYNLVDTFSGTDFFDNFDYYTGYDPADGFVQ